jgi:hypothetical protein
LGAAWGGLGGGVIGSDGDERERERVRESRGAAPSAGAGLHNLAKEARSRQARAASAKPLPDRRQPVAASS